MKYIFVISWR